MNRGLRDTEGDSSEEGGKHGVGSIALGKTKVFRLDLKEPREGFFRRGRDRQIDSTGYRIQDTLLSRS